MPILGLATLALTYRLFLLHTGRPTAVIITFGLGLTRLFYRYCFELLSDLPFLMGVMAFLAGYEAVFSRSHQSRRPRWYDWALLLGGLLIAIAMRPAMWGLLMTVAVTLIWSLLRGFAGQRQVVASARVRSNARGSRG